MFALSYTPPVKPDPYQRDPYFTGQETGFKQMSEVAEDRNEKRRINIAQQTLNLQRQQEARIARENAINQQLAREELKIKAAEAPIIAQSKILGLQKQQADLELVRQNLTNNSSNREKLAIGLQTLNQAPIPSANMGGGRQVSLESPSQTRQEPIQERTARTMEMAKPETIETSVSSRKMEEIPAWAQDLSRPLQAMLTQTARTGFRERMRESSEMAREGKEREQTILSGKPIQMSLATGFGVRGASVPSYSFEEEKDWGEY